MTDNEIIKALERCVNEDHCGDCPLEFGEYTCLAFRSNLLRTTLALINRQKAEIEELAYKLECLLCHATGGKLSKHTYPLDTMERYVNDTIQEYCEEAIEEAKTEARKEFAERLEKELGELFMAKHNVVGEVIDNLLIEMESENNG